MVYKPLQLWMWWLNVVGNVNLRKGCREGKNIWWKAGFVNGRMVESKQREEHSGSLALCVQQGVGCWCGVNHHDTELLGLVDV
jgi:hypothetical protein